MSQKENYCLPRWDCFPCLAERRCRRRPLLTGKTIGVAVVGTQHFWDREAFKGATEEVEKLGAKSLASMAAAIIRCMPITTIFYCHARWTR